MEIGAIHGRFQIFHNGHLEYALQALAECDFLLVGITNPDVKSTKHDETHPARSKTENNPYTFYERMLMIREALLGVGVKRDSFEIVPFPINFPELITNYVPKEATQYTRVYEEWNRRKVELLEKQGYKVVVLHEDVPENKTHTIKLPIGGIGKAGTVLIEEGTKVRQRMINDEDWESYVPTGAVKVIKNLKLMERLKGSITNYDDN